MDKKQIREYIIRLSGESIVVDEVRDLIRCRDCKHWMDTDNGRQKHEMCAQLMPDWFCADGERKETEDE